MNSKIIVGTVKTGQGKGAEAGARTANLDVELASGLKKGLYACEVEVKGRKYAGLLYYGINSLSKLDCLEVHLLDFSGELIGESLKVEITKFIRPPMEFESIEELKKRVEEDLRIART